MKRSKSIKLKAAFLLAVFSLNTVVGFACSLGMDMGFNSKHHHPNEATEAVVHIHKDGKKHIHHEEKEKHSHSKFHHHDQKSHHPNQVNSSQVSSGDKDNCCNDEVMKFEQLDKSIPNAKIVHPVFFTAFLISFYKVNLPQTEIVKDIKQFVRSYHPPISDIRIAIQSFQI